MKTYSGKPQQLQYTVMTQTQRNAEKGFGLAGNVWLLLVTDSKSAHERLQHKRLVIILFRCYHTVRHLPWCIQVTLCIHMQ